jgi:SNF2 family DNA or RNA helicase
MINNVEDLYNVVIRVAGASIDRMSREEFIYRYAAQVYHTPYGLKHQGVKNEIELKEKLKTVMLSRSNIEGLPERIDEPILLSIKDTAVKKAIKEEEEFLRALGITAESVESDLKLNNIEAARISEVRQRLAMAKVPIVMSALDDVLDNGEQLILFCIHRAVQSVLIEKYREKHVAGHGIINGSTAMKTRQGIIDKFQAGELKVIIATLDAMKEGITLTAATNVFFAEWPWTSAAVDQGVGRAHRKGQTEPVIVKHFLFDGGIDKHIYKMVNRKREAICKVI